MKVIKKVLNFIKENTWDILILAGTFLLVLLGYEKLTKPRKTPAEKELEKRNKEIKNEIKIIDKKVGDLKTDYKELDKMQDKTNEEYKKKKDDLDKQLEDLDKRLDNILKKQKEVNNDVSKEDVDAAVDHIRNILNSK